MSHSECLVVPPASNDPGRPGEGMRVDAFLARLSALPSRSQLRNGKLSLEVNGLPVKPSRVVYPGDTIAYHFTPPPPPRYTPEPIDMTVLYEDDDVVVIDKPSGMVVHPGNGVSHGTLVQGLRYRYRELDRAFAHDILRPGIVHRLDRDTSGVIIAGKRPAVLDYLSVQFQTRQVRKTYIALVKQCPPRERDSMHGAIGRDPHHRKRFAIVTGGKPAETGYRIVRRFAGYSLLALVPRSGRTHQLRVHLQALGCPIVGDPLYSRADTHLGTVRLMLHAYRLAIRIPGQSQPKIFRAPIPQPLRDLLGTLPRLR